MDSLEEFDAQLQDSFRTLSDSLDMDFSIEKLDKNIQIFEEKTKEIVTQSTENINTIEDKEYIDTTIKVMVKLGLKVLDTAANEIKIGCKVGKITEWSEAYRSILESIKELRTFKKMLYDMNFNSDFNVNSKQVTNNTTNILSISSGDLLRKIDEVRKNSEMNLVEAKFDIGSEKDV